MHRRDFIKSAAVVLAVGSIELMKHQRMFHLTKKEYVNDILSHGLKINTGKHGISKYHHIESKIDNFGVGQPIFLTSDPSNVINKMIGENWISEYCIVEVDISEYGLKKEIYYSHFIDGVIPPWDGSSWVCINNISRDKISYIYEVAHNKSEEFSICYGGSEGITKENCESVSFYVDNLCQNENASS